jgi:hypothetical protein
MTEDEYGKTASDTRTPPVNQSAAIAASKKEQKVWQYLESNDPVERLDTVYKQPLLRGTEELTSKRSGQKEILDIHLQLKLAHQNKLLSSFHSLSRDFSVSAQDSAAGSIACAFSESEETQRGPWRVVSQYSTNTYSIPSFLQTTASELLSRDCIVELPHVLSVEFQLERVRIPAIYVPIMATKNALFCRSASSDSTSAICSPRRRRAASAIVCSPSPNWQVLLLIFNIFDKDAHVNS